MGTNPSHIQTLLGWFQWVVLKFNVQHREMGGQKGLTAERGNEKTP